MTTTAATTSGALKQLIEGAGISGLNAFRDVVAASKAYPYVTVHEGVSLVPDPSSSPYDTGVSPSFIEEAQIDLWQQYRNPVEGSNTLIEDTSMARKVIAAVHGKHFAGPVGAGKIFGVKVYNSMRVLEEKENIVHDVIMVRLTKELY